MIPLWTIPLATVTGNTLILKPSERDPGAAMIIAELCERAGNPSSGHCILASLTLSQVYHLVSSTWSMEASPLSMPSATTQI